MEEETENQEGLDYALGNGRITPTSQHPVTVDPRNVEFAIFALVTEEKYSYFSTGGDFDSCVSHILWWE